MVSPRILELFLANARWLRGDRYDPKAKHRNVRPVLVHASARRELVIFEKALGPELPFKTDRRKSAWAFLG
jgi:hypothetical protein